MKKRKILLVTSAIVFLIFVISILKKEDKHHFKSDGITYALTVDGVKQNSFPTKGLYQVNVDCTNASGKWDYDNWKLYIEKTTGNVSCDITFTTTSKTYLNNKIISLAGTTQGVGQVIQENGYRYEGKNPNNWIWFNNELWQIIGVFDAETHGVANTNLVKIIRANPIGGLAWDKSNTNDWSNSSLYKLLNPVTGDSNSGVYYNKQNGNGNTYCYQYSTSTPGNCDYTNIGIDAAYRSMIKSVTWHLGGHTTNGATAATFYTAERGSTTGNSNAYASEVTGYIGLMYPSDYGYSVLASSCARTKNLSSYNTSSCAGKSWLYGQGSEWTITPSLSTSDYVFDVYNNGSLNNNTNNANRGYGARPSLYLDASVYVIDGTGTESEPYIIGM